MPTYRYGVFYRFNGPTHSDPLRDELSPEEVERNLRLFAQDLPNYFGEVAVNVQSQQDTHDFPLVVTVETAAPKTVADEAVKRCLIGLELFGKRL